MTIDTVAVLGAGTMGRGIAHVAAQAGYRTFLFDVSAEALERARESVRRNLDKGVRSARWRPRRPRPRSSGCTWRPISPVAVAGADLVIEAVPERMDLKVETFREVARHCPRGALFASNTSSLSITEMAAATDRPRASPGCTSSTPCT